MKTQTSQQLIPFIFKAVAIAMGIATLVLSILSAATAATSIALLSIGLIALALIHFMDK